MHAEPSCQGRAGQTAAAVPAGVDPPGPAGAADVAGANAPLRHADVRPGDYRLVGGAGERALASGLAGGAWYRCDVPKATMKSLVQRTDSQATRDTLLWLFLLAASGALAFALRGTPWAWPAFALYGALYGGSSDARWHEASHGTAFRTRWKNEALYQLASFMILRRPTVWRWSHARHHSDTLVTGRDPEIAVPRPARLRHLLMALFALRSGLTSLREVVRNAFGSVRAEERSYVPPTELPKVVREARVWLAVFAAVAVLCVATRSWWPWMFVVLPSFYGAWLHVFFGLPQHAGLPENVLDHRLNSRTILMNPVGRFLYWNMNYHVEHHMFPMVPYHALPRLHDAIKHDCPPPYRNSWHAYAELLPAVMRQRRDPAHHIDRPLPASPK